MLVHLHLSDHDELVPTNCRQCQAPMPVRVVAFAQLWYVGQVCLRCKLTGWVLGAFDTPDIAHRRLTDFVVERLIGG
jgi:hypothetical protein